MENKLGMFTCKEVHMSGGYPCYCLAGDLIEDIDGKLVRNGKPVYYREGLQVYHFNESTIRVERNELTDETLLSIYGNEENTLNKIESIFKNDK